ncbi:MAG: hypothetical protein ACM31D_04625 [Bacteroidota bacterium]
MPDPFITARDILFTCNARAKDGLYRPQSGDPVPVRVILEDPPKDGLQAFELQVKPSVQGQVAAKQARILRSQLAEPSRDGRIEVGGKSYPLVNNGWDLDTLADEWVIRLGRPT